MTGAMLAPELGDWATNPDRACADRDTELFFPKQGETKPAAVELCRRCPVRWDCLQYALAVSPPVYGIWGGTTETERRRMIRDRDRNKAAA